MVEFPEMTTSILWVSFSGEPSASMKSATIRSRDLQPLPPFGAYQGAVVFRGRLPLAPSLSGVDQPAAPIQCGEVPRSPDYAAVFARVVGPRVVALLDVYIESTRGDTRDAISEHLPSGTVARDGSGLARF